MLNNMILNHAWPRDRPALIGSGVTATWGDLAGQVESLGLDESSLERRRVGIVFRPTPVCLAALALLDRLGSDAFLMDGLLDRDDAIRLGTDLRLGIILIGHEAPNGATVE